MDAAGDGAVGRFDTGSAERRRADQLEDAVSASMLSQIDWSRPWYDAVRPAFERLDIAGAGVIGAFNAGAAALALRNARGLALRFVPQEALPEGRAYEEFIGATGCVPTRDNLHDFF